MFCVIYRFVVHPGQEDAFVAAWAGLTDLIYTHRGSLGSRLHRAAGQSFIAYAQWPDRATWAQKTALPDEAETHSQAMRDSCETIETLHTLEVLDGGDLLRDRPHTP